MTRKIESITECRKSGITYSWIVTFADGTESILAEWKDGDMLLEEYPFDELKLRLRRFVSSAKKISFAVANDKCHFVTYA